MDVGRPPSVARLGPAMAAPYASAKATHLLSAAAGVGRRQFLPRPCLAAALGLPAPTGDDVTVEVGLGPAEPLRPFPVSPLKFAGVSADALPALRTGWPSAASLLASS